MNGERVFRWGVLALAGLVCFLLLYQYLTVILGAILLAYLLAVPYRRIAPVLGTHVTAIGLLVLAIVLVVVPAIILVGIAVTGLTDLVEGLIGEDGSGSLPTIDELFQQIFGGDLDVVDTVLEYVRSGEVGQLMTMVMDTVGGLSQAAISLTILFVLAYALLVHGDELVAWFGAAVPLNEDDRQELFASADDLMYAIVVGNVVIAAVDGVLVGIGLFLTGFGNVLFWTVIAVFSALIPLVGSILIWLPAAVYLAITGNYIAAVALFLYGGVFIGAVDNFLRPYVGAKKAGLEPALFIVGVFTGLALFGVMGLFYGPIALVMTKTIVEVLGPTDDLGEDTGDDETDESDVGDGDGHDGSDTAETQATE